MEENTTIVQIGKNNAKDKALLDNRRHIRTKEPIAKLFTHIITSDDAKNCGKLESFPNRSYSWTSFSRALIHSEKSYESS